MKQGITLMQHPGKMTDGQLSDLATLAGQLERKSPRYAAMLRDWVVGEVNRRDSSEAIEPGLLTANYTAWSNGELADAVTAAAIALIASENTSPAVRDFLGSALLTTTSWSAARLRQRNAKD